MVDCYSVFFFCGLGVIGRQSNYLSAGRGNMQEDRLQEKNEIAALENTLTHHHHEEEDLFYFAKHKSWTSPQTKRMESL